MSATERNPPFASLQQWLRTEIGSKRMSQNTRHRVEDGDRPVSSSSRESITDDLATSLRTGRKDVQSQPYLAAFFNLRRSGSFSGQAIPLFTPKRKTFCQVSMRMVYDAPRLIASGVGYSARSPPLYGNWSNIKDHDFLYLIAGQSQHGNELHRPYTRWKS